MKTFARVVIFAYLLALFDVPDGSAQEAPRLSVPFDGAEAFGHILHSSGLAPVASVAEAAKLPAEKTLIVLFGDLEKFEASNKGFLASFRDRGGALLLVSDYREEIKLPNDLITIVGSPVVAGDASIYRDQWNACPLILPKNCLDHPICANLTKGLATNRPTLLRSNGVRLRRLGVFAEDCRYVDGAGEHVLPDQAAYILGSNDVRLDGRIVVIAGQGLFLNGMLMQKDNDNFTFSWNTIRWLAEGPHGSRAHALFINEGKVVTQFALPLTQLGPMPIPPIQVVNRMIRELENENVFNRFLTSQIGKEPYLRVLLVVASLMVLIGGAWRIMNGRFRLDTHVPLLIAKQQVTPAALPVAWQRQEELHRLGNYWEPAQVLARQFFLDHAGLTLPLWDEQSAPPRLESSAGFWQRRKLARQVLQLWMMALSSPGLAVSARQFDKLLRLVADASAGLLAQQARFVPLGATAR